MHEFKNPSANLKWNRAAVYAKLSGAPNYWTTAQVDVNFFNPEPYPGSRPFDPDSIMMVTVPAQFFSDGNGFALNGALSASDKLYVASLYPRN